MRTRLIDTDCVNVATTEVDFGTVPMTRKVTRVGTLYNVGRAPLRLVTSGGRR